MLAAMLDGRRNTDEIGYSLVVESPESQDHSSKCEDESTTNKLPEWCSLSLLAFTVMWLFADQNLMAPNLTAIAKSFGMTDEQRDQKLGGEVSLAFFLVGGAVSLVIGQLSDSCHRINMFVITVWLGSLPCLLTLWVTAFWQFLFLRMLTGISIGGALPIVFSLTRDLFPPAQRSLVSAAITIIMVAGTTLGQCLAAAAARPLGWRAPFALVALPGLLASLLVKLIVSEPKRGGYSSTSYKKEDHFSEKMSLRKLRAVFQIPTNCLIFIQGIFGCVPWSVLNTFLADYLHTDRGLSEGGAAAVLGAFSAGYAVGTVAGGVASQHLYNRRKGLEMTFCGVITALGTLPFFFILEGTGGRQSGLPLAPLAFLGGLGRPAGPALRAAAMNVNPADNIGTMFSVVSLSDDLGKGIGPVVVAALISLTSRVQAFKIGFGCWFFCGFFIILMFWTVPKDEQKLQRPRFDSFCDDRVAVDGAEACCRQNNCVVLEKF